MIRRGFWLGAGAILGITGYRRVARLVRTLTGQDRLVLTRQDTPALGRDVPAMARAKASCSISPPTRNSSASYCGTFTLRARSSWIETDSSFARSVVSPQSPT